MSDFTITQQTLEDSHEILLTAVVSPERTEKAVRAKARQLGKKVRIPGFRPGKAPVKIILSRLGREYVVQEAAEEMIDEAHAAAIETVKEEVASGAALRDIKVEPLSFEFVAPKIPEVELGDYRSLRVELETVEDSEVEAAVAEEIESLLKTNEVWVPADDKTVAYGDLVTVDIVMTIDGQEELNEDEWELVPSETEFTMAPEFDAAIVGMKVGESKAFSLSFPDDALPKWAGKEAEFAIEVKAIKTKNMPELTDDFVAEYTSFETVADYKEDLAREARVQLEAEKENAFQTSLWEQLKEQSTIRFAPATLYYEVLRLEAEREDLYKMYGLESIDQYLKLTGGGTREAFRKSLEPEAQSRLEEELVLDKVIAEEKLDASLYELQRYLRDAGLEAEDEERLLKQLEEDEAYRLYIRMLLLRKKAHALLTSIARGEAVPEPGQHPVEDAPEEQEESGDDAEPDEVSLADDEAGDDNDGNSVNDKE